MLKEYNRGTGTDAVLFAMDGTESTLPRAPIMEALGVSQIIRVPNEIYPTHATTGTVVVHFGLPVYDVSPHDRAVLSRLMRHGHFMENGEEKLPLLSFEDVWIATVNRVIHETPYERVPDDSFENTLADIKNIADLKEFILGRYQHSLPNATTEDLLSQGVSVRHLTLHRKASLSPTAVTQSNS